MARDRDRLAETLLPHFNTEGRFEGLYDPPSGEGFVEVVPGGVWQSIVYARGSAEARFMRVYQFGSDNADLLRAHWRNEVRALMRLSARRHPSLPVLRDAGVLPGDLLGYVILDDPGEPLLAGHPVREQLQADRTRALRSFVSVVEAISLLHRDGMVHRTLTPTSVCARRVEGAPVLVDGFQMSAFMATWLQGRGVVDDWTPGSFLPSSKAARVFMAPERLASLFGGRTDQLEGYGTDVFSLGMLGTSWFVGDAAFAGAREIFPEDAYDAAAHERMVRHVQTALRKSALPTTLQHLLLEMTEFAPANRVPSAIVAYEALCKTYGATLAWLEGTAEQRRSPLPLYYLQESVVRLHGDGLAASPPEEPDYAEYNEVIERDLASGFMTWCEDGFRTWQTKSNSDAAAKARVVLIGKHYTHFCQYLNQSRADEDRRVLIVKFLVQNHRAMDLRKQPLQRSIPDLAPAYFSPGARSRPVPSDTSSWEPLVESVRSTGGVARGSHLEEAGRWLLSLDEGRVLAGTYKFAASQPSPGRVTLRAVDWSLDGVPDDEEVVAFARLCERVQARPLMGECFRRLHDEAVEEERQIRFEVLDSPTAKRCIARLRFSSTLDPDTVQFEVDRGGSSIPQSGWVRVEDVARQHVVQRQRHALTLAAQNYQLSAQLRVARAMSIYTAAEFADAAAEVEDPETRALLQTMLRSWPIFLIQGPPGTGKTFLAAHYVNELLRHDPYCRVLIAAQSHHALDNLLERIAKRIERDDNPILLLRAATDTTLDKVGEETKRHLPAKVLEGVVRAVKDSDVSANASIARLQRQWREMANNHQLDIDIGQRLHRAASVMCVSSNSATAKTLRATYESGSFDVVVLEEAARGWITEMLVPLVHANRWVLIGDQKQLPAFGATEVTRAHRMDVEENVTGKVTDRPATKEASPYLTYFASLMEAAHSPLGRHLDPRHLLNVQRRMHPDIATLISTVFYDARLQSHSSAKRAHGLAGTPFEAKTGFVWIDTSPLGEAAWERSLENYCEVQLIRMLIDDRIRRFQEHEKGIPAIRVLTPYKRQLAALRSTIKMVPQDAISTVDAFQGREAEVVFVSLTRNNTFDSPSKGLGFLQAPERTNVMFSRARRLLVVVGALEHFARFENSHWKQIVAYVRSEPRFRFDPTSPSLGFRWVKR